MKHRISEGQGELEKAKITEVSLLQEGRHHEDKSNCEDDAEPGEPPSDSQRSNTHGLKSPATWSFCFHRQSAPLLVSPLELGFPSQAKDACTLLSGPVIMEGPEEGKEP